jgi:dTDP-4-dehydrorhamnose 3,5-epimerase
MKRIPTPISDLALLEPTVFGDERGWFMESHNAKTFAGLGIHADFVQDNHSRSRRGILRGLHYQIGRPQDKLVRCIAGRIFDVAVDIRRSSPTFGHWFGTELSAENKLQTFIPKGFAHGFLVLSEVAEVVYKVTDYWSKDAERGLRWDDPALGIAWPAEGLPPQLAARDAGFPGLREVPVGDLFA